MKDRESEKGLFAASAMYLLAAVGLVLFAAGSPHLSLFLSRRFRGIPQEGLTLIVNVLYYGLFLFLPIANWTSDRADTVEWLRLNPLSLGATIRTVLIAVLSVAAAYNLTMVWTALWQSAGLNVASDSYIRPTSTAELVRSVISVAVVAGISEELLFRGVLLTAWENRGPRKAAWITAILFAMLHGSLLGLPAEIMCGLILAVLVRWTNSLYAGMIFHSAYNAALTLINYVSTDPALGEATSETVSLFQAMGGARGAVSLLLEAALIGMLIGALLNRFRILYLLRDRAMQAMDRAAAERLRRRALQARLYGEEPSEDEAEIGKIFQLRNPDGSARSAAGATPIHSEPLSIGVLLLIFAGAVTTLALYALDVLSML